MEKIETKVIEIIKRAVNLPAEAVLTSETPINTLQINSLNFLKVIVDIEEEYDIEFDDEELNFESFNTIKDFAVHINKKMNL